MGTPRPTATMQMTSGEMESMGGKPTPTNSVLHGTNRIARSLIDHEHWFDQTSQINNAPTEELCVGVERISCQAEAHVQPEYFWICVERSDQSG